MRRVSGGIDATSAAINRVVILMAALMAVMMVSSLCAEVFFRYILRHSLPWSEEVALLLFTWVVLLVGSIGVREGFHVRITLFVDWLPARLRDWLERITLLAILGFGVLIFFAGWGMMMRNWLQVAPAMRYPLPLLYGAVPMMGALIALHALALVLRPSPFARQEVSLE